MAGYTGMCIHFRDFAEQKAAGLGGKEMLEILSANGMQHNSVEFLTDWFLDGEAASQARKNEALAFEAALALEARTINVGGDLQGRNVPRDRLIAGFKQLCSRAATNDIAIALELVAWSDIRDVSTALEVIDGMDNAGLAIDAWHVFRAGLGLETLVQIPSRRILCIQVNDAEPYAGIPLPADTLNRKLCGTGAFDLRGFLAAVDATGADIPVSVEVISPQLAALDAGEAARISYETARHSLWPGNGGGAR